jgi:hypothetical protein
VEHLDEIGRLAVQSALRLFVEGLTEQSVSITSREGELFNKIKELKATYG